MKKLIILILLIVCRQCLSAQNVGIGTTEPQNKLQLHGNLLITAPTTGTLTAPTAPQTKTMVNATTITFINTDSIGRIYDPGGAAGNYLANMAANANVNSSSNTGIEVTVETMGLGAGDSLFFKESSFSTSSLLAVGDGYTTTGKYVFNTASLYLLFKSNADASTGLGFSLLFRRLYNNSATLPDVSGATGNAFLVDMKNGSIRSGLLNNATRGTYSTAMGYNTIASGDGATAMGWGTEASDFYSTALGHLTTASSDYSTALGSNTIANGPWSTAMGSSSTASGNYSTAMGSITVASGNRSTAMGYNTTASGGFSTAVGYLTIASGDRTTAMGYNTTASGDNSTALGNYVNTNNHNGSFLIGDNSTTTIMNGTTPNNFRARFDGGYRFYTSSDYSTSCALSPGANAWSTTSDVRLKENFETIDGEVFLNKIAAMNLTSWNYIKQDPAKFRHYGPMAQDFYAAFGKDKYGTIGNDTTINSSDFAGVSFIAIQAIEKRTQRIAQLEKENNELTKLLLLLKKETDDLQKRVELLEQRK